MYVRGKGNEALNGFLPSYFGADFPTSTWRAIMQAVLAGQPVETFPPPAFVTGTPPNTGHAPYTPPPSPTATPRKTRAPRPTQAPIPTPTPTPTPTSASAPTAPPPKPRTLLVQPGRPDLHALSRR